MIHEKRVRMSNKVFNLETERAILLFRHVLSVVPDYIKF